MTLLNEIERHNSLFFIKKVKRMYRAFKSWAGKALELEL
jgi:hypothetical protein